jgi:hypothetical protein
MPCIDDPCSSSPVILEATSNLQAAYRYIQSARDVAELEAGAVLVKNALAAFEKATAKCQAANHAATAPVVSKAKTVGFINVDWGAGFGGPPFQAQFTPELTFEPPFFTFVKLSAIPPAPINPFAPSGGKVLGGDVNDITGFGTYSRCTGQMSLLVSFTTVTNELEGTIPDNMKIDTFTASLTTSSPLVTPTLLPFLQDMAGASTSFSNSPFSKQPGNQFFGGLSGLVSIQGGILASILAANPSAPKLLNLTMTMPEPFPLV